MKIGVFDSGIGGRAIADSLQNAFTSTEIVVVDDRHHMPYGDKNSVEVLELTNNALQPLLKKNCDIIVIACNTATAIAIEWLRHTYPKQLFIGLEPMVKTAALLSKTQVVAVCATPATLASERYLHLKARFGDGITFLEPDCASWANMIQLNTINKGHIKSTIKSMLEQQTDVIVLACTHYHWIRGLIEEISENRAQVIDPSEAIIRRVQQLATEAGLQL